MADSHKDVFADQDRFRHPRAADSPGTEEVTVVPGAAAATLEKSIAYLLGKQSRDGAWSDIVRSSVRTTAEFVIVLSVIERMRAAQTDEVDAPVQSSSPNSQNLCAKPGEQSGAARKPAPAEEISTVAKVTANTSTIRSAAAYIANKQLPIGGWSSWKKTLDLDTSVLAYVCLKLAGHEQRSEHMLRARDAILACGGVESCDPFIWYYLAFLGEVPYSSCLPIPPEFGLLPAAIPGSWASNHPLSRAVLTAVGIVWAQQPVWLPGEGRCDFEELWKQPNANTNRPGKKARWTLPQRILHILFYFSAKLTSSGWSLHRQRALHSAEQWLLDKLDENHGVAGDATATIWALLAFLACGRSEADDSVRSCLRFLDALKPVDGEPGELGVAMTDVRDTALACRVLGAAGCSLKDPALQRSVDWLLCREVQQPSDSDVTRSALAGWSAQGRDVDLLDVETTGLALLALREQFTDAPPRVSLTDDSMVAMVRASSPDLARRQVALLDRMAASSRRTRQWLVSVQNFDGGWSRFGKCRRRAVNDRLPWCGRLLPSDASSPSVTGLVLESISRWEQRRGRATRGAINYLLRTQSSAGTWCDGPGGRGPIFATWRAVCGLRAADVDSQDDSVQAAATWLMGAQRDCGGWRGETRHADLTDRIVAHQDGPWHLGFESISVVHTAWALLALMAAGHGDSQSVRRGLQFLMYHQQAGGNRGPDDLAVGYRASTDCGIEHMASVHYPLLALAEWICSGLAGSVELWQK